MGLVVDVGLSWRLLVVESIWNSGWENESEG